MVCMVGCVTGIGIPIVTTSVATITNDLGHFDKATWITSAYLLGYIGVLIIWTKLSDIFGRKSQCVLSLLLFIVFSAGCGAALTTVRRIICRAFQGIWGGGTMTVFYAMAFELFPRQAISDSTHWRWIFIFSVPVAVRAVVIVLFFLPSNFPLHGKQSYAQISFKNLLVKETVARVDLIGVVALWAGVIALTTTFEEAGISHGWSSALVIALLVVGGLILIGFFRWEYYVTKRLDATEPVFPWYFATNRIIMGLLLAGFSQGMPWIAGIKTIPFSATAPVGSLVAAIIAKKGVPPVYIFLFGSALRVLGLVLLGTLSLSTRISHAQSGYQVLVGFGSGTCNSLLTLLAPSSVKKSPDKCNRGHWCSQSLNQSRFLGGAIALGIINTAMSGFIQGRPRHTLPDWAVEDLLKSAKTLSILDEQRKGAGAQIPAQGYNLQFEIIETLMMWQPQQQIKAA
ncbi:MFS general substrate transporter [Aaosphaeria arxii CBS 175.79]|uniref:MFS general substrate transporter n=1 Tax=Aaosphaeria arxii CBS 175.79 TaxID=1450172 RepID=A0A6A5XPM6_9PLEO|nr:MFS general substrate transporter [Aaosphaeria arxii CBS 175.79]KAF2014711.1 MFS general substrate transporter [Aaosphaeria arxii CBS 175.79]